MTDIAGVPVTGDHRCVHIGFDLVGERSCEVENCRGRPVATLSAP